MSGFDETMTGDMLAGLNPPQREAVTAGDGPLLILAGPGSGKTRVIAHRIAYLVEQAGVAPWRIAAVTFTNKAAREMRDRVLALLGAQARDLTMGTFHSVCSRILRVEGGAIGIDRGFSIYDDGDQVALVKRAFLELAIDSRRVNPRAVLSVISKAKSELKTPEDYAREAADYFQEVAGRVYKTYQRLLDENRALDFDDLIVRTVELFRVHEPALDKYRQRYLHLLVDEFQDTNIAQYVLTRLLASGHGNVCVVGDPDQSIYAWRSADVRNILNFERDFPNAHVVVLEQNYRSTQTILDSAQSVISLNQQRKEKALWTNNGRGQPVILLVGRDEQDEARLIVEEIQRLMKSESRQPKDFAIMYRTNAQSRAIEEALVDRRIPYRLVGGTRFYERREIKDILAYLRAINNPFDSISLLRVINAPARGIGSKSLDELVNWAARCELPVYSALQLLDAWERGEVGAQGLAPLPAPPPRFQTRTTRVLLRFLRLLNELIARAASGPLTDLIGELLVHIEYRRFLIDQYDDGEERWDNVQELLTVASQYQDGVVPRDEPAAEREAEQDGGVRAGLLAAFLEDIALVADVDDLDERADSVTLITLHAAKGLEFPVVFIAGLEEGLMPHSRSYDDPTQMEEERRLCYVGITRAKDRLYLTRALGRTLMGGWTANPLSRFVKDIPVGLTKTVEQPRSPAEADSWPQTRTRLVALPDALGSPAATSRPAQPEAFPAGTRVRHAKFGDGIVVDSRSTDTDQEVVVAFKGEHGIKRLLASFARLERL